MIKFIKKKKSVQAKLTTKFVIYYSATDLLLGSFLLILVVFFCLFYITANHAWM